MTAALRYPSVPGLNSFECELPGELELSNEAGTYRVTICDLEAEADWESGKVILTDVWSPRIPGPVRFWQSLSASTDPLDQALCAAVRRWAATDYGQQWLADRYTDAVQEAAE